MKQTNYEFMMAFHPDRRLTTIYSQLVRTESIQIYDWFREHPQHNLDKFPSYNDFCSWTKN